MVQNIIIIENLVILDSLILQVHKHRCDSILLKIGMFKIAEMPFQSYLLPLAF